MADMADLRDYISRLEGIGELQPIDEEVDPYLEVGAIIRRSYDLRAPAPLFNRVRGARHGTRILGAPVGASAQQNRFMCRIALSLGLGPEATLEQIMERLIAAQSAPPVKPVLVPGGPCKENICTGERVNLDDFCAPLIHQGDGGRYFNTWGTIVVRTPDGQWTNWAIARFMQLDGRRLVSGVVPGQHTRMIHEMWAAQGKAMPFALFQGGAPLIPFVSGMAVPEGVDESSVVGGMLGRPLELVKCETVDLAVPANAEIVVEGTMSVTHEEYEGPMGEFSGGLCLASRRLKPVLDVSAVTFRNAPILPVVAAGYPIEENHTCWSIGMSAKILSDLRAHGLPVTRCFIPFESAVHWLVIAVDRNFIWHEKNAGRYSTQTLIEELKQVIFRLRPAVFLTKFILVADDIDVSDINQVSWAFATRCRPDQHLIFRDQPLPMPLVGFLSDEEKKSLRSDKVIYNCLRAPDWDREHIPLPATFESAWPEDVRRKVLRNWSRYGYRR